MAIINLLTSSHSGGRGTHCIIGSFFSILQASRTTIVTYDNAYPLGDKAAFAQQNGMGGCFTWSLNQVRSSQTPYHYCKTSCIGYVEMDEQMSVLLE